MVFQAIMGTKGESRPGITITKVQATIVNQAKAHGMVVHNATTAAVGTKVKAGGLAKDNTVKAKVITTITG